MIIVPDIHNKIIRAQKIIDRHPGEKFVFLGDYFDDFGDTPKQAIEVARWLLNHLDDPNKTFLFGNHDLSYVFPKISGLRCSGFAFDKYRAISAHLTARDWYKFRFHLLIEEPGKLPLLLSHAGLSRGFTFLGNDLIWDILAGGSLPQILAPGKARGGWARVGGITWCDSDVEFKPVSGYNQIFGHTPHNYPTYHGTPTSPEVWNLDTHLQHYGIWENGILNIQEI